mgnify:FL=1
MVKITKKLIKYFLLFHFTLLCFVVTVEGQSNETMKRTEKSLEIKRKQKKEYKKSRDTEVKRRFRLQSKETRKRMKKTRKDAETFNERKGKSKFNKRGNKPKVKNSRKRN